MNVSYSVVHMFLSMAKMFVSFINLAQSKYTKIHYQEIPAIGHNAKDFFCEPYTWFSFNLFKKFQVAFTCDTNMEYQTWSFCFLFLSNSDNKHTHTHTHTKC